MCRSLQKRFRRVAIEAHGFLVEPLTKERSRVPYWRLSGFYFFYFSTLGAFLPYWGLYLQSRGFTAAKIGMLIAMLVGTKIIAPNIWGWIADHSGRRIGWIRIASLLATCAFCSIFWASGFWWLGVVSIVFSFFWNATLPQFEALTFAYLEANTHQYSRVRLWGSIGFIIAVVLVGYAVDLFGLDLVPVLIAVLLASIWLVSLSVVEAGGSCGHGGISASFWGILRAPPVIAFFVVFMLVQVAHGPYYTFYSIYLEKEGYSASEIGALWALGVGSEVLLFVVMQRVLANFSLRRILLLSVLCGSIRWILIGIGVESVLALVIGQCLHAATFGSAHVSAIHLVHGYFGAQHQGKGQALYSSAGFGLGGMLGSFYSGIFWESEGPVVVFASAAGISLLAFAIAWRWVKDCVDVGTSPGVGTLAGKSR